MLNILNSAVQKKLFSEDHPEILIEFLNQCFFTNDVKITEVLGVNNLAYSFVHWQSCFQDTIQCKVRTSDERSLIVEIDVINIHKGKDSSFFKLRDNYFNAFVQSSRSYAYQLPFLYIGLCGFDFGALKPSYHFTKNNKHYPLDFHLLNIVTWTKPDTPTLTPLEQWLYLFKNSTSIASLPAYINAAALAKVAPFLDHKNWQSDDLAYYQANETQWTERHQRILKMYREIGSPLIAHYLDTPATKVNVSAIPLLHQLNPPDINIDISLLHEKELQKMAFDSFRKWIQATKAKYPQFEILIKDESPILVDFKSSLTKALKSLYLLDKFYIDFNKNWDVGYVLGHISGSLSVHWQHEYVTKQTNSFKLLTGIQVVRDFLKFDDLTKIKIQRLYEIFITESVNIQHFDSALTPSSSKQKTVPTLVNQKDPIFNILEQLLHQQVRALTTVDHLEEGCLDLEEVVPVATIRSLIEENRSLGDFI